MIRFLSLVALIGMTAGVMAVQPPTSKSSSKAVPGPVELEARFSDESILKVEPIDETIVVQTKYGKLAVLLADITRIEFGFRFPEGVEAKIDEAIVDLGSPSFKDRETAEKKLFGYAELAVPALRKAAKHTDPEVSRRAEGVLKRLQDKLPEEKLNLKNYDLVETPELVLRGRIETSGIRVRTRLFGETTMKLSELRALKSTAAVGSEFDLDGAKYAMPNGTIWFDTGVDVTSDQALEITANGTLDLGPNQPGQYMSTPAGNPQNGNGPVIRTPNGRTYRYVPGSLVGRIGVAETPFVIGPLYRSNRPPAEGRLYLTITPSAWNINATGSYKVKVKVGG